MRKKDYFQTGVSNFRGHAPLLRDRESHIYIGIYINPRQDPMEVVVGSAPETLFSGDILIPR